MEAERTCEGCEWQHHRHHCEEHFRHKYGKPCMSDRSIHVIINKAIERHGKAQIT